MVRLKEELNSRILEELNYFNSNMVRLKDKLTSTLIKPRTQFQFQHGSIKRLYKVLSDSLQLNFNSNMVRLKEICGTKSYGTKANFNSNMVRLKESFIYPFLIVDILFQFQHGSIKRANTIIMQYYYNIFQFQHGSIKST